MGGWGEGLRVCDAAAEVLHPVVLEVPQELQLQVLRPGG